MIKKILLLVLLMSLQKTFSQNTFFIGNKSYLCTQTYTLGVEPFFDRNKVEINFIKDGEKGMIAFTISNSYSPYARVKNNLLLYLDNNQVITCVDRKKSDVVNDSATTLYYLTKDEVSKLKKSNISTIRYTFGDDYGVSISRSVSNLDEESYFGIIERIDFPSELSEFYK